jgi:hypothetical protein
VHVQRNASAFFYFVWVGLLMMVRFGFIQSELARLGRLMHVYFCLCFGMVSSGVFLGGSCLVPPALFRLFESLFQNLVGDIHTGVRLP